MMYADEYCTYQETYIPEHNYHFRGRCVNCKKPVTVTVLGSELFAYRSGQLIQNAVESVDRVLIDYLRRLEMKKIHVIGGGTLSYIDSHLALCSPAYGQTAKTLAHICDNMAKDMEVHCHLTKMAGGSANLDTVEDVAGLINNLVEDNDTKIIFMTVAMCDFFPTVECLDCPECGKEAPRLSSRTSFPSLLLNPCTKIIRMIRYKRKDIFLVGFKQSSGLGEQSQYIDGLRLLKEASCNLVLANDRKSRLNMVITPEEAKYHVTCDREKALVGLVEMSLLRSHLTFTRSTVVAGVSIDWDSPMVPMVLREVVDYCIAQGAYKPFNGVTVGHFAAKIDDHTFITSKRKTNFNNLRIVGLVRIETDGPDSVIAYGSKPSVGGQSQRIIFKDHPEYDCIVHFHCPILPESLVPIISQREYECGSHQCGQNTSQGLRKMGNLACVYLENHGPNIVFSRFIDPLEVIKFIEANFNLSAKTGGPVSINNRN